MLNSNIDSNLLKFSKANRKLKKLAKVPRLKSFLVGNKSIYSFDLPAGHTCPSADICMSKEVNGRIVDGPNTIIRCYAASEEVIFKNVRKLRNHNLDLIKNCISEKDVVGKIRDLILRSLPMDAGIVRVHSSGDFFIKSYFEAWLEVAKLCPDILFYGYTKNAIKWLIDLKSKNLLPPNFRFTFSIGGKQDNLIKIGRDTVAKIVYSSYEARKERLPVDHNDAHAALGRSAALIIHGIGPKGSKQANIHYKNNLKKSRQTVRTSS